MGSGKEKVAEEGISERVVSPTSHAVEADSRLKEMVRDMMVDRGDQRAETGTGALRVTSRSSSDRSGCYLCWVWPLQLW